MARAKSTRRRTAAAAPSDDASVAGSTDAVDGVATTSGDVVGPDSVAGTSLKTARYYCYRLGGLLDLSRSNSCTFW